jgi:release factor glutamine methyltransferase
MTDPGGYRPTFSTEYAQRVRAWHESAYQTGLAEAGTQGQTFVYLGRTFVVPPQVMPITAVSHLLGHAVLAEVRPDDRVLDLGTGSGVNAILAAATARQVLAVDINPHALAAAAENARRNGVADRIEIRHSDVFRAVDGDFDLIIFDPPFRWFAPRDVFELASTDQDYRALTEFFGQAAAHLAPGGRMLIFFGTSGDLEYLHRLADEHGFDRQTVAHEGLVKDGWQVDYYTYRMMLAPVSTR